MGDDAWKERVFHFFFPRFAARFGARGCTWRLVKGLTYDVLPCRSVECGSSTSSSCDSTLPRYQGILFLFPLLYSSPLRFFLFSSSLSLSLSLPPSLSLSTRSRRWFSRVKRARSSGQKTTRTANGFSTLSSGNIEC